MFQKSQTTTCDGAILPHKSWDFNYPFSQLVRLSPDFWLPPINSMTLTHLNWKKTKKFSNFSQPAQLRLWVVPLMWLPFYLSARFSGGMFWSFGEKVLLSSGLVSGGNWRGCSKILRNISNILKSKLVLQEQFFVSDIAELCVFFCISDSWNDRFWSRFFCFSLDCWPGICGFWWSFSPTGQSPGSPDSGSPNTSARPKIRGVQVDVFFFEWLAKVPAV